MGKATEVDARGFAGFGALVSESPELRPEPAPAPTAGNNSTDGQVAEAAASALPDPGPARAHSGLADDTVSVGRNPTSNPNPWGAMAAWLLILSIVLVGIALNNERTPARSSRSLSAASAPAAASSPASAPPPLAASNPSAPTPPAAGVAEKSPPPGEFTSVAREPENRAPNSSLVGSSSVPAPAKTSPAPAVAAEASVSGTPAASSGARESSAPASAAEIRIPIESLVESLNRNFKEVRAGSHTITVAFTSYENKNGETMLAAVVDRPNYETWRAALQSGRSDMELWHRNVATYVSIQAGRPLDVTVFVAEQGRARPVGFKEDEISRSANGDWLALRVMSFIDPAGDLQLLDLEPLGSVVSGAPTPLAAGKASVSGTPAASFEARESAAPASATKIRVPIESLVVSLNRNFGEVRAGSHTIIVTFGSYKNDIGETKLAAVVDRLNYATWRTALQFGRSDIELWHRNVSTYVSIQAGQPLDISVFVFEQSRTRPVGFKEDEISRGASGDWLALRLMSFIDRAGDLQLLDLEPLGSVVSGVPATKAAPVPASPASSPSPPATGSPHARDTVGWGTDKSEVQRILGQPSSMSPVLWYYGPDSVTFDFQGKVSGWNNSTGLLRVWVGSAEPGASPFTLGSPRSAVARAMGTPNAASSVMWFYGGDSVTFDFQGRVSGWNNSTGRLRVSVGQAEPGAAPFTRGSSRDEVARAMGTPKLANSVLWYYGQDFVTFDYMGRVNGWSNRSGELRAR